ncbi:hypothetical protein M0R45_025890 [Rubus argutus]|uniref:Uncharacterized protein n=1 Tax=Rubus argutus TaxID=59490 RepID=A0AAW1WZJ0_RUBAR
MSPTSRVTDLVNRTEGIIELYECEEDDYDRECYWSIQLQPNTTTEIAASRFVNNQYYSMEKRVVNVKRIENNDYEETLTANEFVTYQTFIFMNNDQGGRNGPLVIKRVLPPEWILASFFRTK